MQINLQYSKCPPNLFTKSYLLRGYNIYSEMNTSTRLSLAVECCHY